jgi:hypothetical protein
MFHADSYATLFPVPPTGIPGWRLLVFAPAGRQAAPQVRLDPFPSNHKATLDLCQVKIVSEERGRAEEATPVYEILQDNRKTFFFYP